MFVKLEEVFGSSINPINEAFHYTGEKEFHKAFAKATGFKTHAGGYFGPAIGSAHIKINLYDCLNYNKHLPRPGVYGDLEIKRVTPMNEYEQAEMDIVYQGVEMKLGIGCFYPPRVAKAKNKQVIDLVLKQAGIKADYEIVIKAYQPYIELSEENFNKLAKIKVGDKIGDFLVYDAGIENKKSVEQFYLIMTSYKEQLAFFATKNPAINESTSLNESLNDKEFFEAFTKTTHLEVGRNSKIGRGRNGQVEIDDYTAASIRYGWFKRGNAYGDFEITSVTPVSQNEFDMVARYGESIYKLHLKSKGSQRVSSNLAKDVVDQILAVRSIINASGFNTVGDYLVIDVTSKVYSELRKTKLGHTFGKRFGDIIVTEIGKKPSNVSDGNPFIMEVVTPEGFAELVFRDADELEGMSESTLNESVKIFNDAAKLIAGYLNIKFKPTGTPDVFEVSGRDRMKIEKLQEGDILDNNMMVDGIVDDNYTVNIELRKPGMSRAIIVRFTDEPEMFESTLFADLNSVDEKTLKDIVKSTFKVLGTKVGRDVSVYDNCIEVTTGLITTAKLEAGVVKMGSYSGIKFVSYEEGKSGKYDRLIVEYNGELYPIAFQVYTGYADLRFAKAGELLKDFSKKYRISTDNADVNPYSKANTLIQVSEAEFKKLPSLVHRGDEIGDAVVVGVGEDSGETRLFRGKNFHVTIVTPKHQAGFTFIPENYVSGLREDEAGYMNESMVELNEVTGLPKHKTSVPSHML